tara:strand:- start:288 stop:581 length:294 start_codon:yes stop_codon:yes gene_type:complete
MIIDSKHKKRYEKYTKVLPDHKRWLKQRQSELKDVLDIKKDGDKKFHSNDNVVNIRYGVFKNKSEKLITFIQSKIDELEYYINDMEDYIKVYEETYK